MCRGKKRRTKEDNEKLVFHSPIAADGQSTEETEKGFRTRAFYGVTVQERLEPREVVRRRRMCRSSSEECFFLQWHMEHSATGD